MYNNQQQFDLNSLYPNNPYADNQKFLKQIFSRPFMLVIIISIGIILLVNVYNAINSSFATQTLSNTFNLDDPMIAESINRSTFTTTIIPSVFSSLLCLIPFIGFLIVYIKSKNPSDSSSIRPGITLLKVFSIIEIVLVSLLLLLVIFVFVMLLILSGTYGVSYQTNTPGATAFLFATRIVTIAIIVLLIISAFYLFWAISVLRFCLTVQKAVDSNPMVTKGSTPLFVLSIIFGSFMSLSAVISLLELLSSKNVGIDDIMLFVSVVAAAVLHIFIAVLAHSYKKAVNAANYSISYSGANRYTSNVSSSTAYFQSTYQSPYPDQSNPPYSTQSFEKTNYYQQPQQFQQNNVNTASEIHCPSCGAVVASEDNFCNMCGNKIK